MKMPNPRVPKNFFKWPLRRRQFFCKWYWSPYWKFKYFCEKWMTRHGLKLLKERVWFWWYCKKGDLRCLIERLRKSRRNMKAKE